MDAKTTNKLVNALMSRYIKLYQDTYKIKPTFNRYTEKWGFQYMLEDLGANAQNVLDYYFTLKREHSTRDLLTSYHDLEKWMAEDAEDEAKRRKLREETKKRVEEFERTWQRPST